jgi:hypothetical protein
LLMRSHAAHVAILRNIHRGLNDLGHLILVAPSVESALLTHHRRMEWRRRNGIGDAGALPGSYVFSRESGRAIADGHLKITDVPTKHFLREELLVLLSSMRFEVRDTLKLEYSWTTEFDSPPRWMRAPYPWDWLVVCRKR